MISTGAPALNVWVAAWRLGSSGLSFTSTTSPTFFSLALAVSKQIGKILLPVLKACGVGERPYGILKRDFAGQERR